MSSVDEQADVVGKVALEIPVYGPAGINSGSSPVVVEHPPIAALAEVAILPWLNLPSVASPH